MSDVSGFERSRLLLLPEAIDDYVGANNPIRFDAFVDGLDLAAAEFARVAPKATINIELQQIVRHIVFEPGAVKPPAGGGKPSQH